MKECNQLLIYSSFYYGSTKKIVFYFPLPTKSYLTS